MDFSNFSRIGWQALVCLAISLNAASGAALTDDPKDTSNVRQGTGELFAGWEKFGKASTPLVVQINTQGIDELRAQSRQSNGLFKVLQLKSRVEEISGLPCLVVHYTQIQRHDLEQPRAKAIVLTAWKVMANKKQAEEIAGLIRETSKPLIGFCGAFHQIYLAHGGESAIMRKLAPGETDPNPKYMPGLYKEWGIVPVRIVKQDPIFAGLSEAMQMPERHYAQCAKLPEIFDLLASSQECRVQMIKHKERLVYGTQFHPEIYDDQHLDGRRLLENFFRLAGVRK